MADAYDSDSSLSSSGDTNAHSTSVLLGYPSPDPTDDPVSHLGGAPDWLVPSQPPSASLATCRACGSLMPLLLQLNADLPDRFPGHERRLYVWGCRRRACRRKDGSVRALRGVRVAKGTAAKRQQEALPQPKAQETPRQDIGAALFGSTTGGSGNNNPFSTAGNPFSTNPGAAASANPFANGPGPLSDLAAKPPQKPADASADLPATFASKARLTESSPASPAFGITPTPDPTPFSPWPASPSDLPKPYPHYHLDAEYEYLSAPTEPPSSTSHAAAFLDGMDVDEGGSSSKNNDKDAALAEDRHDKTFQTFADTLAQNPEQALRYEHGGAPLLYGRSDAVGAVFAKGEARVPRCGRCGGARVFEVQLVPGAIAALEEAEEAAVVMAEGMEWGTIIVGVCARDCGGEGEGDGATGYVEEWAGVQWEEVVSRSPASGGGGSAGKGKGKGR